ncbi:MAG: PAS domain S-box protein [Bacteroidetes bacterium]|nr:PAS domain S-box protein [Bacteroidota bacterium]
MRINILNKIASDSMDFNDRLAFQLAEKALTSSRKINYSVGQATANTIIACFYNLHRMPSKALEYIFATRDIYENLPGDSVLMYAYQIGGIIFLDLKRFDRAEEYMKAGLSLATRQKNTVRILKFYVGLGDLLKEKGKFKEALNNYYYALFISKRHQDFGNEIWTIIHLGNLYLSDYQYEKALAFYQEAVHKKNFDHRIDYGTLYTLIGHIYEMWSDYDSTLYYDKKALASREKTKFRWLVPSSLMNLGHAYTKMGKLDSALFYTKAGIEMAIKNNSTNFKANGYNNLYQIYFQKKDWQNAFLAFKEYIDLKEKLSYERNQYESTIMEVNRIITEKELQTRQLKTLNAIQSLQVKNRNLLVLLFFFLLILMIFITVFIMRLFIKKKKEKENVEEINFQLKDEIKEKEILNEELSRSEQQFRFLADHASDPIALLDSDFKILYVSPYCEQLFGYTAAEVLEMDALNKILHPESLKEVRKNFHAMLEYRDSTKFIWQAIRKDGSVFWAESTINPIFDDSTNELQAMLAITRDISKKINQEDALMEAAAQKEMLIKEVHHRVKNNLAILASMVSMQQRQFSDTKTVNVFADLQFRVRAMALVHEQLYKSRDIEVLQSGEYLTNLITIVASTFGDDRIHVHLELLDEIMEVKIILPLGLILNELLTNTYKYAFPDNQEGNIWVRYEVVTDENNSLFPMRKLTVKDDGTGLPDNFTFKGRTSMGSQIIDLLSQQLEAEIEIDGTHGACFSLFLPVKR